MSDKKFKAGGEPADAAPPARGRRREQKALRAYDVCQGLTRAGRHYKAGETISLGRGEAAPLLRVGAIAEPK